METIAPSGHRRKGRHVEVLDGMKYGDSKIVTDRAYLSMYRTARGDKDYFLSHERINENEIKICKVKL